MTGYIDAAVMGVIIKPGELKCSAKGTAWSRTLLVIGDGDHKQFAWVCAFGETAKRVTPQLAKGGKLYAEGELSAEIYQRDGQPTVSLSIAARRVEVLNQIGKAKPKRENADRASYGDDRRGNHDRSGGYSHSQHERPLNHEARR